MAGGAGAIAPADFGRIVGAARQWWRAALLLAPPVLCSHLRPCIERKIFSCSKIAFRSRSA